MVWIAYYTALTHVNIKKTARWIVCESAVATDIQEFSVFRDRIMSLP